MTQYDPFRLDMLGNTSLSSGFDLGMSTFVNDLGPSPDDDDPGPTRPAPAVALAVPVKKLQARAAANANFYLADDRGLAASWKGRAIDNLEAIRLAASIESEERPSTREEQGRLIRFTCIGASELDNSILRRPGEK